LLEDRTVPDAGPGEPPVLNFSSLLGGYSNDTANAIAVDVSGNMYLAGHTSTNSLRTTPGAVNGTYGGGGSDAFVAKVNADGSLGYLTYLGGSGADFAFGIAVDAGGSAYVTGQTTSADFSSANAIQGYGGGADAFVAKLNPTGTAIVYATFLGGAGFENGAAIAVDAAGNVFVAGSTGQADFLPAGSSRLGPGGGADAFVLELDPSGSRLLYASYVGGTADDYCNALTIDHSGHAYITGNTKSTNFPTAQPIQSQISNDGMSAFVAKLSTTGTSLEYSTYLGGDGGLVQIGTGIAVDGDGAAYVMGSTHSAAFPTMNALQPTSGNYYDAFVLKLNPFGSSLVYSTYLGGGDSDTSGGIAVDAAGNAYVTGFTYSPNFPLLNAWQGPGGGRIDFPSHYDAFVARINADGRSLAFSSFLGGSGGDRGIDVGVDAQGNVYVTGETNSVDFPSVNALQTWMGGMDAFVTKIAGAAWVNSNPTISAIPDQTTEEGTPTAAVAISVSDAETPADALVLTATSSNPGLVPDGAIVVTGTGQERFLTITPLPDQSGTTAITVSVSDAFGSLSSTTFELVVVSDEGRIYWRNRGQVGDGFDAAFGARAPSVRNVVQAAIDSWARVISSFNYEAGPDSFVLDVVAEPTLTFGGLADVDANYIDTQGLPHRGRLLLGVGVGTESYGDMVNGWFIDPTPDDSAEFTAQVVNAFAGSGTNYAPDLFSVAVLEMTHLLGLSSSRNLLIQRDLDPVADGINGRSPLPQRKTFTITNTGIADDAEGYSENTNGDPHSIGTFWTFDGESIDALLTSNNGGGGEHGLDFGEPLHTAGPRRDGGPLTYAGITVYGSEDSGNAVFEPGTRYLPSNLDALILHDVYGYSITMPETFGSFYSVLNQTSRELLVRGSGEGDSLRIFPNGDTIEVHVDCGNDIPGTGPTDEFVSVYNASQVQSIRIDTGSSGTTANEITVYHVGIPVSVSGFGLLPPMLNVLGTNGDDVIVEATHSVMINGSPITFGDVQLKVDGRAGNDVFVVELSQTTLLGGTGDDTFIVKATRPHGLLLDGQEGADKYTVALGNLQGDVTIADSGTNESEQDSVTINGTIEDDEFVLREGRVSLGTESVYFDQTVEFVTVDGLAGSNEILQIDVPATPVTWRNITVREIRPPSVSGAPTTQPNAAGWYNQDVTIRFVASDSESGIARVTGDQILTVEGADLAVMGTATDGAGNSASYTITGIKIDKTAPATSASLSLEPNGSGWVNADVTVSFTVSDALSGMSATFLAIDGGTPQAGTSVVLSDGIHAVEFWSVDAADNEEGHHALTVMVDTQAPVITAATNSGPVIEGSEVAVSVTAMDPAGYAVRYEFDFDNDGAYEVGPQAGDTATHTYPDNGTDVVGIRVTDGHGWAVEGNTVVQVDNAAPRLAASGVLAIAEGNPFTLTLGPVIDAGMDTVTAYRVHWGDGTVTETAASDLPDDHRLTHVYGDGANAGTPRSVTIDLLDEDGTFEGVAIHALMVTNVAPAVTIRLPDTPREGDAVMLTTDVADPSAEDQQAGFTYHWAVTLGGKPVFLDGILSTGSTLRLVPMAAGTYTVTVTMIDRDGGATIVSRDVGVAAAEGVSLRDDPLRLGQQMVVIGGTGGDDIIQVNPGGGAPEIKVTLNGAQYTFSGAGRVLAFGHAGNDTIQVVGGVTLPTHLYGGAGSDSLSGGGGTDVLVGGDGDDILVGGQGRDILIGGFGADRLVGNQDEDMLIAGTTAHEGNAVALDAILTEWTSASSYADRVSHLSTGVGGLNGAVRLNGTDSGALQTIFNDNDQDTLTGSQANDWFLANRDALGGDTSVLDIVTDFTANETYGDTNL
jgi:hypothetical protein